ncbi:MAG: hypothetical protein A3G34_14370 [Candidatus Lindowbacteria bacterium RIFCSPLOWO2_12_FULL_62_27]|nr:MAG: hypothetical protein A3G34_14370 [Candidatus Lindowbacteria bacterium RIFCSPLOWO2_12_FULL_62_27]
MSQGAVGIETVDWEAVHRLSFVDEPGCWTSGCQSYCCTHKSDLLAFSILTGGAGMIFFEAEYDYLRASGRLQKGFESHAKRMSYELAPGLHLRFVLSKCELNGICTIRESRPLCCKLYPFLPRVDPATSALTGFVSGTVFDAFWPVLGVPHPCTLAREKADAVQARMKPSLTRLLGHPYFLFHFRAVEILLDRISEGLDALKRAHAGIDARALSRKWELLYLTGKAFDGGRLRADLLHAYSTVAARFPGFEI